VATNAVCLGCVCLPSTCAGGWQEGLIECYTPGYLINGDVTGGSTSCAGTVGACETLVTCHTDAGYTGLAVVTCPTDGGFFRLRGCSREAVTSDTGEVYSVAPFQQCGQDSIAVRLSKRTSTTVQVRTARRRAGAVAGVGRGGGASTHRSVVSRRVWVRTGAGCRSRRESADFLLASCAVVAVQTRLLTHAVIDHHR
jgi:hypothetical protein